MALSSIASGTIRNLFIFFLFDAVFCSITNNANSQPELLGVSLKNSNKEIEYDDIKLPSVQGGSEVTLLLYGLNFQRNLDVALTARSSSCNYQLPITCKVTYGSSNVLEVFLSIPRSNDQNQYYFCFKTAGNTSEWISQGNSSYVSLFVRGPGFELPLWAVLLILFFCVVISCVLSGLNLGLMTLDRTDLLVLQNAGTEEEQRYAKKIMPVREKGNFLLCSILFALTCINSIFTVFLDSLFVGWVAVIISTFVIVLFCEILPQAICSRHGLKIGYSTIYITIITMMVTSPLSWPIGRILDILLGKEIGSNVSSRARLKELIRVTSEFTQIEKDEINIIHGALEFGNKKVEDIMTYLDDIFMISDDSYLDFQTISGIIRSGYSRVPIYKDDRTHIVGLLMTKDLAVLDPDDNVPVKNIMQSHKLNFVPQGSKLYTLLKELKTGTKGHMAFVYSQDLGVYKIVDGIVTLEDVIEELLQSEINDETDVYTDNRSKRKCVRQKILQGLETYAAVKERSVDISPHLKTAAFQYLITEVEPFKPKNVSSHALSRLLRYDIYHHVTTSSPDGINRIPAVQLYTEGKSADFFIMILQGKVLVRVGIENLTFQSGPFAYFGTQALMKGSLSALPMANSSPVNRLLQDAFIYYYPEKGPPDLLEAQNERPPDEMNNDPSAMTSEENGLSSESNAILLEAIRLEATNSRTHQAEVCVHHTGEPQLVPPLAQPESSTRGSTPTSLPVETPKEGSPQNSDKSQAGSTGSGTMFIPYYTVSTIGEVYYMRISRSLYHALIQATLVERAKAKENAEKQAEEIRSAEEVSKAAEEISNGNKGTAQALPNQKYFGPMFPPPSHTAFNSAHP